MAVLPFMSRDVNNAIYDLCTKLEFCLDQVEESSSMQVQPDMQPETDMTKMQQLRKGWPQQ